MVSLERSDLMTNLFFNTLLHFTTHWDYTPTKAYHADSPGVYTSDENLILSTVDEIQLKCDLFFGSVVMAIRVPILFSFVLDKPAGNKAFCEPEAVQCKRKPVLNTESFYLKEDNNEEVVFNGEMLTLLTIQMIEVRTLK